MDNPIINPNYLNMPQQVQKNKDDIEYLLENLKNVYSTTTELNEQSIAITIDETNIPQGTTSGFIIDPNGLLFSITGNNEGTITIKYYSNLKGPIGRSNTLSIGTVTTLETGEQAQASITGVAPNQTLNLSLPKGNTGEQGPQGLRGETGEQGPQGIQGPQGKRGFGFYTTQQQILSTGTTQIEYGDIIGYDNPQVGDFVISENEQSNGYYGRITSLSTLTTTIEYIGNLKGEKGINFVGAWVSGGEYYPDDIVTYNGNAYICIFNITDSTINPSEDSTHWNIFVSASPTLYEHNIEISIQSETEPLLIYFKAITQSAIPINTGVLMEKLFETYLSMNEFYQATGYYVRHSTQKYLILGLASNNGNSRLKSYNFVTGEIAPENYGFGVFTNAQYKDTVIQLN